MIYVILYDSVKVLNITELASIYTTLKKYNKITVQKQCITIFTEAISTCIVCTYHYAMSTVFTYNLPRIVDIM